jgi:hypothetical protein
MPIPRIAHGPQECLVAGKKPAAGLVVFPDELSPHEFLEQLTDMGASGFLQLQKNDPVRYEHWFHSVLYLPRGNQAFHLDPQMSGGTAGSASKRDLSET